MEADMKLTQLGIDAEIVMLVHDSVVAIVKEDQIDEYSEIIDRCIQKDRGLTIPGCPIGIESDSEDGGSLDYSCGKFAKQYPELV